jgi:hypothetical protein
MLSAENAAAVEFKAQMLKQEAVGGKSHRIVFVIDVENSLLFAGERSHAQKELGDVIAQPV